MFSATTYTIRLATAADDGALRRLAALDEEPPLATGPVLVGELGGSVDAALSLDDGRVIANPFVATGQLLAHLRLRAGAIRAYERTPSLPERIRAAMSGARLVRPLAAHT